MRVRQKLEADGFERGQNEALGTTGLLATLLTKLPPQGKPLQRSQPFTVYLNPDNPEVRERCEHLA